MGRSYIEEQYMIYVRELKIKWKTTTIYDREMRTTCDRKITTIQEVENNIADAQT